MNESLMERRNRGKSLFPFGLYDVRRNLMGSLHWHHEMEIVYAVMGDVKLKINETEHVLSTGDFAFINAEDLHGFSSDNPDARYFAFVFPLESLNFEAFDCTQVHYMQRINRKESLFPVTVSQSNTAYERIQREIQDIIEVNTNFPAGYELETKAALFKIISALIRHGLFTANPGMENAVHRENLKKVLTYLLDHSSERISLNAIAAHFHLSPKYFCKFFKQNFGKTFVEYLNILRIENACRLLKSSDKQIIEIAFGVGFDNISYFIRKFKEIVGTTPSKFR